MQDSAAIASSSRRTAMAEGQADVPAEDQRPAEDATAGASEA
jgi:hypothetical protein